MGLATKGMEGMKRFISIAAAALILAGVAYADDDDHDLSIQQVTDEIRAQLGLGPNDSIDADVVPPALLERLGEAVMISVHPDTDTHEWMDEMMGGEGSESLAAAHRWMGYRYLTGGYGAAGMMGPGMMGSFGPGGAGRRWGMMGNPSVQVPDQQRFASPEDIVRRRYAAGEITREEYLQMMDDLEHGQ